MKEIAVSFDNLGSTLSIEEVTASRAIFYLKRFEGDFAIFRVVIRDVYSYGTDDDGAELISVIKTKAIFKETCKSAEFKYEQTDYNEKIWEFVCKIDHRDFVFLKLFYEFENNAVS